MASWRTTTVLPSGFSSRTTPLTWNTCLFVAEVAVAGSEARVQQETNAHNINATPNARYCFAMLISHAVDFRIILANKTEFSKPPDGRACQTGALHVLFPCHVHSNVAEPERGGLPRAHP